MHQSTRNNGFSVLEITITLVAIGLLLGGLLGKSWLIRSYELRALAGQEAELVAAINQFRDKYQALPGDFATATTPWGQSTACGGAATTITATCNGDGNGYIIGNTEEFLAWQHLANADLLDQRMSGQAGPGGASDYVIATNIPEAKRQGSGWVARYVGEATGAAATGYFSGVYSNILWLMRDDANGATAYGILTPTEALSFDQKYDDGLPAMGKIVAMPGDIEAQCTQKANGTFPTAGTDLDATYAANTSYGAIEACSLMFRQAY